MESKIQPILCCVGAAVAGRPTQFLMERAFEAAHCDWRVITVEVQPENFQTALAGMQAMSFTALRFFPELQELAASRLREQTHATLSMVTSAMRRRIQGAEVRWDCWDNQGYGLLDLLTSSAPAASTLLWLHGRSRLTQSLYEALQATSISTGQLIWSDIESPQSATQSATQPATQPTELPSAVCSLNEVPQKLRDALAQLTPLTHLVVVGEGLAEQLPLIRDLQVAGDVTLLLATNQLLTRQRVHEAWPSGKSAIFTESDRLLAAEAYDFRRWTGQPADMDLLRDAYDEYADF
ncbi:MAG: hypothetical protein SFV81_22815 [Pirellulaceae bacterium]|nr:hypothetical protein [Pirellulaceae bacterium]